jgi:hypothetical protein
MVVVALVAVTTIVTIGMAIPIVKPAYAQLDDISEIGEIEIPDSDAIREKVEEVTSQSVPRLAEQASALGLVRPPPALAG